ncbi:hypothetical protein N7510_011033 [Penicillium lagena]|uniref:uncharacterized protein n=1 Tax=Penicillium lagena TaxID=94218 RepID=UPI002540C38E|nr:uncharacterized protein N7510_011033 [Penicillium lagena]KAJ5601499.1 hypothetical protein N7510_011033 [Penicillium lagena]
MPQEIQLNQSASEVIPVEGTTCTGPQGMGAVHVTQNLQENRSFSASVILGSDKRFYCLWILADFLFANKPYDLVDGS